jgi:hypothetical protein
LTRGRPEGRWSSDPESCRPVRRARSAEPVVPHVPEQTSGRAGPGRERMASGRGPGLTVAPCTLAVPDSCRPQGLSARCKYGPGLGTDCGRAALVRRSTGGPTSARVRAHGPPSVGCRLSVICPCVGLPPSSDLDLVPVWCTPALACLTRRIDPLRGSVGPGSKPACSSSKLTRKTDPFR